MNIYIRLIAFFAVFLFRPIQGFNQSMTISYPASQSYTVGTAITPLSPTMTGGPAASAGQTITFAGTGSAGSTNGAGTAATFNNTLNTAVDAAGNVYVADAGNHMVRKITPAGVVSTLAGSGLPGYADGTGATAVFKHPSALTVDAAGNVFVSDQQNHRIRKISPVGVVTTVAGNGTAGATEGTGAGASFSSPIGLALDASGNLYVADYGNNKIRKITTTGVVSTFAGTGAQGLTNGVALSATFKNPMGIAIDASGIMYVADRQNYVVRKISAGTVSTLAGSGVAGSSNGTGTAASFNRPNAVAVDAAGNVYIADDNNMVVRKITPAGVVTILAGAVGTPGFVNGTGDNTRFNSPYGLSVDAKGYLYVADQNNYSIRKTVTRAYTISPALPTGLVFNETNGSISGTPTVAQSSRTYSIQAFNATYSSNVATISIVVASAVVSPLLPSQDQNYVITYTPRTELLTLAAVTSATSNRDKLQISIEYIDGLGRSLQQVEWQGSPNKRDLVTPIAYDAFGREDKKYLPYSATVATSTGSYKAAAITDQNSFYTTPGTTSGWASGGVVAIPGNAAVSKTIFEASPLSRVLEQGASGAVYQPAASRTAAAGRTSVAEYKSNVATGVEAVKLWVLTTNGASCGTNAYAVNKLYRTIAKDENWTSGKIGTIEEYKDFEGKVVLKRIWETETVSLSTYYVYDDFGNLRYVIPPAVTATAFTEVATDLPFNQFVYAYHYDTRHRTVEKKIPGKEWEYLIYNALDQVVLTQDGVQRSKANQSWTATKYDVLGRVIMTGIHTYGATANLSYRAAIQALIDDPKYYQWENKLATGIGYTEDRTYPAVALNPILSIQYYDDYTAPGMPYNQSTVYSKMTKGLPTASQVNVLGTANRLWTVNYYDNNGRVVKTYKQHYQSGAVNVANYDEIGNTYNFSGDLVSATRLHRNAGVTTTITNTYEYDHMGRKKLVKEKINTGAEVVLSKLSYNEVGQLAKKELHSTDGGTTFLQNTQYAYNSRGWLKTGTSAEFSMKLKYEDGTSPQYNGNIANQEWGAAASLSNAYTYSYDRLNRILNGTSTGIVMSEALSYDVMGNIKTMNRDAAAAASTYNYTGNRLTNITGGVLATGNYSYDVNGNATTDGRTGVVLTYNLLNLPATATRTTPAPIVNLTYTYDAMGNKLRKVSTGASPGTRHYIDGIEYNGNTIEIIRTEDGLARNNAGVYSYEYNLTDHLGNVRYSFNKHPTTGVIQRLQADNYYAFGKRKVVSAGLNKYLYNGKEIQDELGEQYDYGARFYDPVIGRWNVVDKLAEHPNQIDKSTYAYAWNNPVKLTDPDGNCPLCPLLVLLGELTTTQIVTSAIIAGGGAYLVTNGINQLNRNNSYSDQDNISSPQLIVKTVSDTNKPSREHILETTKDKGSIYKVPGSSTKSGKPYIGRHNKPTPQKTRKSNDGRDRKKAEVIDTYDPSKAGEGAYKEQKAMDENGGLDKLDNKRREVSEKKMEEEKKKHQENNSGNGNL